MRRRLRPAYRERYRLRFNVASTITNDFAVGFSIASGDLGDPISTNSTETGFFTRKPIAIDKAFGIYNPHYFKPLTLDGRQVRIYLATHRIDLGQRLESGRRERGRGLGLEELAFLTTSR